MAESGTRDQNKDQAQGNAQDRRCRGRPQLRPDQETRQIIYEAARQEFAGNGYAATSMEAVARLAGVSTKTLYRLIPTKADLFSLVVTERTGRFMLAFDSDAEDLADPADALERILIAYGTLTLEAETIAINRLVIGECDRFPEIAALFYANAIVRTNVAMTTWLTRLCERGQIQLADPQLATGMLRGMMILEPQRAAILGQRPAPDAAEIAERARACAALFLNGCRPPQIGRASCRERV